MEALFANIIVDISHERLDRTFQYRIPKELEDMVEIGMVAEIPFGTGNRIMKGYIISLTHKPEYDLSKIKEVIRIVPESIQVETRMIQLAWWIKNNYGSTMNQALKTVMLVKEKIKTKETRYLKLLLNENEVSQYMETFQRKHYTAKIRLLEALSSNSELTYKDAVSKYNISGSVISGFEKDNLIQVISEDVYRNPIQDKDLDEYNIVLSEEQRAIVSSIVDDMNLDIYRTYLVHGVTGSGKTEVYMEIIDSVIKNGKQAIVLIPEIALTYQTVMRFYKKFKNRVSIINSRLSKGERYDQMLRARRGEIDIMIGPRSALFTPFLNLGLIVIDEEHEKTYKSEGIPKYHARETAIEMARMSNASVILGSATPSVESYHKALAGEYKLYTLNNRINDKKLPIVYTVDLRDELKSGNRSILSNKLRELIEDRLKKNEQVILFINRRGYAGFVSCRACGHVMKCPHCDVSLSQHNNGKLVCHYCGYTEDDVKKCPNCGSKYIGGFRAGTQQIEEVIKKEYPEAKTLRMDMDTTKGKHGHKNILSSFSAGDADILIGTQMIVKGHDFPNVTLVGILAADLSLYANDYRAGERTFQLLTQAAGRAGRAKKEGEVVIQTYNPDHYSIKTAAMQDYLDFYNHEISYRELLGYPPTSHILAVLSSSKNLEELDECSQLLKRQVLKMESSSIIQIIGPADEGISKVNDIYKKVMYLKHKDYNILIEVKDYLEQYLENNEIFKDIFVQFDFDPMNSY